MSNGEQRYSIGRVQGGPARWTRASWTWGTSINVYSGRSKETTRTRSVPSISVTQRGTGSRHTIAGVFNPGCTAFSRRRGRRRSRSGAFSRPRSSTSRVLSVARCPTRPRAISLIKFFVQDTEYFFFTNLFI